LKNLDKYNKQLKNKIEKFSGSFMNNSKWTKLFKALTQHHVEIKKCFIKNIFDDVLREIKIPSSENYDEYFSETGVKDSICTGGPLTFKEIEQLIFPNRWEIKREMRSQILEPKKINQSIAAIKNIADLIGKFETEHDDEKLILYGYK